MDPITLALGLSKLVPVVSTWFAGDSSTDTSTAEKVLRVAQEVSGISDPQNAVNLINSDPALHIKFQQAMQPVIVSRLEETTKRLQAVNETMRAEVASKSWYIAGWRPTLGYAVTFSWLFLMAALCFTIFNTPDKAPAVINSMASLSFMWGIALSVLGINVQQRSKDKQLAAGVLPVPGLLASIASRVLKK